MKNYFLVVSFLLVCSYQTIFSQDFNSQFKVLFDKNDVPEQQKLLQRWEDSKSNEPEFYIAYFNFYLNKSRRETVSLTSSPTSNDSIKLTKEDDKNVVAYLGGQVTYEKISFDKAIKYISEGVEKFPNRLDMRFGKIASFGNIADYKRFTDELVKTIDYSNVNKNQWVWADNKTISEPRKMFLSTVQDYFIQVYESGDENVSYLKSIAETVLKYYPDSVENLSNSAIYYMLKKDYDKALEQLLKAEKLAPTDSVVIGNIAWSYYLKGDKTSSLKYYKLLLKYGDEQSKIQAKDKIAELKQEN